MKLKDRVKELENKLKAQQEVIDFLSTHDRNDIILEHKSSNIMCSLWIEHYITYIYNGILKSIEVPCNYCIEIIENKDTTAIIKFDKSYYRLYKREEVIVNITDIYKPKVKNKKTTKKN
jgi:hypothetical protein